MNRKRVLIVGNEPSAVENIESCLTRNGYTVTSPPIPIHEALPAVERDEPHLILMDVCPEYEADVIRTGGNIRAEYGLPVVYITGKETCGAVRFAEPIGYVTKPVDEGQLLMIVETAFYKHDMESKLKEYERRLDSIMNIFTDLVYRLDRNGTITFINDAVRKYGYTPDELMATDIFRIIHPDDRERASHRINERRTGERRTRAFEFRLMRKGEIPPGGGAADERPGKPPVLLLHSEGIYSTERPESSGFIGTQGIAIDITERREIEEALRRSEYRYRSLFENMDSGAAVYEAVDDGKDFILRDINGAGERMEGVKREKVLGKKVTEVFPWAEESGLLEVFRRVWSTGKPEHHSTPLQGDGGTGGRRESCVCRTQSGEMIIVFEDVSGGLRRDEKLYYRLCLEEAIFEISVKFINCKPGELDSRILDALKRIGECLEADRSYVFLFRDGDGIMVNPYEWCSEGVGHRAEHLKETPVGKFPWLVERLRRLETVHIPRVADLPPEAAAEAESLRLQGVRSSVVVPLVIGDIPDGFLGLDSVRREKAWSEEDIKLLKIVGETIISALERAKIEKALEFEHAQLLSIFDSINEAVYVSDTDTYEILYVNRHLRELLGKDPTGKLCYREFQGFDEPCDFCTNEIIKNLRGEPYRWEYHNPILDKDYMIVDRLIKWPDSRNVRFEFTVDITERKKAEEEIRKQNDFLSYLLESLTHPFFVINVKDHGVVTANTAAHSTMLNGAKCYEVIHGMDKPCPLGSGIRCPIEVIKETKKHVVIEHTHTDRDGNERVHEIHGFPIFNEKGEIEQIIEYLLDITERKQLESQFLQAQKMESIGRLAGGIAHDFNNLLTAIIGNVELILMTISRENIIYEEVHEIKKSAERAADLTRHLLAFSRRQVIEPRVVDLNDLIKGTEKMLRRLIGEDIELLTRTHEGLWPVRIDPGQVEQVLTNLVVNARDAMPGGGTLIIETGNAIFDEEYVKNHMGSTPGEYVMMAVSDTGTGMDERTKQHIFEPFFTTKEKWKGTGLGLSTCYGIVKQNNGFIWVYSEPGHGTTMKIYLPRVHDAPQDETGKEEPGDLSGGIETILLVEDEPSVRKMISRTLSEKGYRMIEAANGEEALRLMEERKIGEIHLVIADVIMPRMGGRELVEKAKLHFPGVKALYISGYTDNSIVNHCVLPPGRNFLQKPFSTAALIHKVRQVLNE